MLLQLTIENFAIIEGLTIDLDDDFIMITGETGSGKSILVEALELVTGARFKRSMVKDANKDTLVEAVFRPGPDKKEALAAYGYQEELLVVQRRIKANGSSVAMINGRLTNLSLLEEITTLLMDIHGQNENQSLLRKENYLDLLDGRHQENQAYLAGIQEDLAELEALEKDWQDLDLDEEEKERERDLLNYQLKELSQLDLDQLDEEALEEDFYKLQRVNDMKEELQEALVFFRSPDYGQEGGLDFLERIQERLASVGQIDRSFQALGQRFQSAYLELEDLYREISSYERGLFYDEEELGLLNDQLALLNDLKRKYGTRIEEIVAYRERIKQRLADLEDLDQLQEEIQEKMAAYKDRALEKALALSQLRQAQARQLEADILKNLQDLSMKEVVFQIDFKERALGRQGIDRVDFLIQTNRGSKLGPLAEIASGGEMSRLMLGFKAVLADSDRLETLVFDEIDTGISGRTAQVVGEKILDLARQHQIIVISHLPQIAALSSSHLYIEKVDQGRETLSTVRKIEENDRIEEISRLIGGVNITDTTRKQAQEMLEQAENLREERNDG